MMSRPICARLAVLVVLALPGCTSTAVFDVDTTPDGRVVTAVGGRWSNFNGAMTRPLRWTCVRGADERLTCTADEELLQKKKLR